MTPDHADLEGAYRYSLVRQWGEISKTMVVIGLNPSIADQTTNDATIRVLISYGKKHGFTRLLMLNLYAYIATDPADLFRAAVDSREQHIIGFRNQFSDLLTTIHKELSITMPQNVMVFAAWGNHGLQRGKDFIRYAAMMGGNIVANNLRCFGITKQGAPRHPLRCKLESIPYSISL